MGVDTRYKYWPKIPSQLTLRLKELKKSLVAAGIEAEWSFNSKTRERNIRIRNTSLQSLQSLQNGNQARISKHKKGNRYDRYDRNDTFPNHSENEKGNNNKESEDETVFESDDEDPSNYDDSVEEDADTQQ